MELESESNYLLSHSQMLELLRSQKSFKIINDQNSHQFGKYQTLQVEDQTNQYTLIIISLLDGVNQISSILHSEAMLQAKIIKQCNHSSVVKYYDEFMIDGYYFIQIEKCNQSLQCWANYNQNKYIDTSTFSKFALQLLEGLKYLHSQNLILKNPSLQNIFLNQNNDIKLIDIDYEDKHNKYNQYQPSQLYQYDYFIYAPPECLEQENTEINEMIEDQQKKGDIWSVCMFLYVLAGAKQLHILKFKQGKDSYQTQFQINHKINSILKSALQQDPNKRPTIDSLIEKFQHIEMNQCKMDNIELSKSEKLMFQQVIKLFESKIYEKALVLILQLVELSPLNDQYLAWLGRTFNSLNLQDESEYWSNEALLINPNNSLAYFNLGNTYKNRKMSEKSIYYFEKSLEINPTNVSALNNLGLVYDIEQKYEKGNEVYMKAHLLEPNKGNFLYNLGRNYNLQNKDDLAIKSFEKVLEVNPNYIEAYYYLGTIHKNEQDKSIMYFKKSLQINCNYEYSLLELGKIYYKQKSHQLSLTCLKKAKKNMKSMGLNYSIASNSYCQKKYENTIKFYKKVLKINPNETHSIKYLRQSKLYI